MIAQRIKLNFLHRIIIANINFKFDDNYVNIGCFLNANFSGSSISCSWQWRTQGGGLNPPPNRKKLL